MKRVLLVVSILAAACSGGDESGLRLEDPWARPSPDVATTAAFFLTMTNSTDVGETLVAATTEACRVTELHQSQMTDGVMRMQQVEGGITVGASETVILAPGGLHIMCIDKLVDFALDEEIDLTLEFIDDGCTTHSETVTAVVEDR